MQANKTLANTKTTMRHAFEAAIQRAAATKEQAGLAPLVTLMGATSAKAGIKKVPVWRVTRRGGR